MHTAFTPTQPVQVALLMCGLIASLLKVATDAYAGTRWKGYSFTAQSISELSARGAPTRPIVLLLDLVYAVLMIAFGIGLWQLSPDNPLLRFASVLVIANPSISSVVSLFLPMRLGEKPAPAHVVPMAIAMFTFLFAMIFGGLAYHGWFRLLSLTIPFAYVGLAAVRLVSASRAAGPPPGPTVGVQERTMVAGYLVWVAVLSIMEAIRAAG